MGQKLPRIEDVFCMKYGDFCSFQLAMLVLRGFFVLNLSPNSCKRKLANMQQFAQQFLTNFFAAFECVNFHCFGWDYFWGKLPCWKSAKAGYFRSKGWRVFPVKKWSCPSTNNLTSGFSVSLHQCFFTTPVPKPKIASLRTSTKRHRQGSLLTVVSW